MFVEHVLSGMRPTGRLHLGHFHGVLANWIKLQHEYPCLFFVADWHALTTAYDEPGTITQNTWDMVVDWLAAGVDPAQATIFIQSRVPEHAELHLLLSMMTPLGWLERVPTYKDQQEKLTHKDLTTYGFLGYPLLQAADILIYRADKVPVGEDQVPHIEFTREIARRFNHLYGTRDRLRGEGEGSHQEARRQARQALRRTAHPLPGEGRGSCAGTGACGARRGAELVARRPRAPVRLSRGERQDDSRRAGRAADRGLAHAGTGWPEDVEVLRQHHCVAGRRRLDPQEDQDDAD